MTVALKAASVSRQRLPAGVGRLGGGGCSGSPSSCPLSCSALHVRPAGERASTPQSCRGSSQREEGGHHKSNKLTAWSISRKRLSAKVGSPGNAEFQAQAVRAGTAVIHQAGTPGPQPRHRSPEGGVHSPLRTEAWAAASGLDGVGSPWSGPTPMETGAVLSAHAAARGAQPVVGSRVQKDAFGKNKM